MAGRICDQLKARYGNDSVYMDIDNIPVGVDFREHIYAALDQTDVLVAIVGPKWLGTRRGGGRVDCGVVERRRLSHSGKQRVLPYGETAQRSMEVRARG